MSAETRLGKERTAFGREDPVGITAANEYPVIKAEVLFGDEVGQRAFVVWNRPMGKTGERHELNGFAQVCIKALKDGRYSTVVLHGSGVAEGTPREFERQDLYCTRRERAYFGRLVAWLIDGKIPPGERPPIGDKHD